MLVLWFLYMILVMIIIHVIVSLLSFLGRTIPKKLGDVVAVYEMIFYIFLITFHFIGGYMLYIGYFYFIIHLLGGVYYIQGGLSRQRISKGLIYYGFYETFETLFLLSLFYLFLEVFAKNLIF